MRNLIYKDQGTDKKDFSVVIGLFCALLFFTVSGFISYSNTGILKKNAGLVAHTHEVITSIEGAFSFVKDAETGQRGYVLTGKEEYLEPYNTAVQSLDTQIELIRKLTADNFEQQEKLSKFEDLIKAKLKELEETIHLRRTQGFEAALNVVLTNRGKKTMDDVRMLMEGMRDTEKELRRQRIHEMDVAYNTALVSGIVSAGFGILLALIIAQLLRRANVLRHEQEWFQKGEAGLAKALLGDLKIHEVGEAVLKFLAEYFDVQAGVFFVNADGHFTRVATYGLPEGEAVPQSFSTSDGLLGQAVKDMRSFVVHDVPDGYITVGSGLGQSKPRHLIISPAISDNTVTAVFELGFIHPLNKKNIEFLEQVSKSISVVVQSANYRESVQNLLEETQRQAEELQTQSEELRVSNEELEEQSRALQESQVRLEQQQAELEQTNAQLEEQTQFLEIQRDDLEKVQQSLHARSKELEQASQYKSDFLANMSHELRTPLNSSLILAKLLADNNDGNLTSEQISHAKTIQSAGNDLLNLINDILDLSKIEAGHMEILPEPVILSKLAKDIQRTFEPIAKQKNLNFIFDISSDCPKKIQTDGRRFEQILKNLLSNALKFTEKGQVKLSVFKSEDAHVSFAVSDTGIGISSEQQKIIFEAFRQADGNTNRKYGGTGLGLSISRELTRLLGGKISLSSELGKGSTFTVILPEVLSDEMIKTRPVFVQPLVDKNYLFSPSEKLEIKSDPKRQCNAIDDDRSNLSGKQRILLVVEDDESFARILYDIAHDQNFQCLISTTADDAIQTAIEYIPSAILLDVGLPDHSGLSVLDRLKQDSRTRHIPVHVISAEDYSRTAYSLGAVGYMIKPVQREDLVNSLKQLEEKFINRLRRVLVVEDDKIQRESVQKLLSSHDVETIGVGTAAECLDRLKSEAFDCMVLDLSLPDATGYSLLETLSNEEKYAFPPVIVYTGHDLSSEQEQLLRRYSKSIIIKGAKSPERLLDEVTLFLHQVVSDLPAEQQNMLKKAKNRDAILEGRRILIVEDDIRNVYSLSNILEPRGAIIQIARNGKECLEMLNKSQSKSAEKIDLVLMDMMMPEMDGLTATRKIREMPEWKKLPIIMLTAKAMQNDQKRCMEAGVNDYMAKPLDVEKLLSLVRVWMPR